MEFAAGLPSINLAAKFGETFCRGDMVQFVHDSALTLSDFIEKSSKRQRIWSDNSLHVAPSFRPHKLWRSSWPGSIFLWNFVMTSILGEG